MILCKALGIVRSGYYDYLKRPIKTISDRDIKDVKAIQHLYDAHFGTYGAKRIAGELRTKNHIVNHKRVSNLMKEMNIKSKIRVKKSKKEEKIKSAGFVPPNLLERHFDATLPNRKWVTDMSELVVNKVKFYFSAIMDLYNREIIAFVISDSPNLKLIEDTLYAAMETRSLTDLKNILIHSDQGSVYRSFNHHQLSKKLGFIPSMSRKANCWDNAVIESFFSHLKTEFPHQFPVNSAEQVMEDLPNFIKYFNNDRSQKRLGYLTPTSFMNAAI
ncbi:IS3 family transposase [Sporosarcina sp. BP05]|uniref:IS3 family transposase n=1 Tax=Sporosarcina sp. BP05 TaxID=2758726 RepID=UPI00351C3D81